MAVDSSPSSGDGSASRASSCARKCAHVGVGGAVEQRREAGALGFVVRRAEGHLALDDAGEVGGHADLVLLRVGHDVDHLREQ